MGFNIETSEKRGDRITHDAIHLLHTTFITPIDRDAIHRLITRMNDTLDLSEDCRAVDRRAASTWRT